MIPAQRQQKILELLTEQEIVSIAQLMNSLDVSHMTVRRDIQSLEQEGYVVTVSGGVRLAEYLYTEPTRLVKSSLRTDEKASVAKEAAQLVHEGATIYLDAGTTCLGIAKELAHRDDITVLTNDFTVAAFLSEQSNCELYHTGGKVLRQNESCVGESAARFINALNIEIGFLSASSWDMRYISTPTEEKVPVKQAVVNASLKCVLVTDSSKYGKVGFFKAVAMKDVDTIVTDDGLDDHTCNAMRESGIRIILAKC